MHGPVVHGAGADFSAHVQRKLVPVEHRPLHPPATAFDGHARHVGEEAHVAIENIFLSELKPWRVALVFAFGFLHGMGFAGALKELGLPRSEFVTALLTFNVGVEAGQLAVIGAVFKLVGWHCANRAWSRSRIVVPVSTLTACTAVYWTIERLSS